MTHVYWSMIYMCIKLIVCTLSLHMQQTRCTIKIFTEPMPNSNERSIQLMGTVDQIQQCVHHFLDEISKVGSYWSTCAPAGLTVPQFISKL